MAITIRCVQCSRKVKRNPRIKEGQHYCGLRGCQQARKNLWEQEKNKNDGSYRTLRRASKKQWLKEHPGSLYQEHYRATHPDYVQLNRKNQVKRNQKRKIIHTGDQIVKTDALNAERLIPAGLYTIKPYRTDAFGKIVKTDALIVQLTSLQQNRAYLFSNSP
jgi:hypothetical protein